MTFQCTKFEDSLPLLLIHWILRFFEAATNVQIAASILPVEVLFVDVLGVAPGIATIKEKRVSVY